MNLDITLRLAYAYAADVGSSRHLLRVLPRELPGVQRVLATHLDVEPPPAERSEFIDAFGNPTQDVFVRQEHAHLEIAMRCRVARSVPAPAGPGAPLAELGAQVEAVRALDADSPHHGLGRSVLVEPRAATTAFARECLATDGGGDAVQAVRTIGAALHRAMAFDPLATRVDTPFERAFELRRGVCQDFTHVMIACLRGIGIPAGYVSGYLRTLPPQGQARRVGVDAMHAWVRAWCGAQAGWIEYDPTNALEVRDEHVVVARGRDYFDVAPLKGVLRTAGAQHGSMAVDVVEMPADSLGQ